MPDDLPRGPLRELTEALHELYRAAGTPGLRTIADTVTDDDRFRDTVSHQKVSAMLHGSGVPKWSKLEPVVRVLAEWSTPQRGPSDETRRFKRLWDAVIGSDVPAGLPVDERDGRVRSVFVLGGVTGETNYPDFEKAELERFSQRLGATVAQSGADLIVCSPFPDSVDFHALRGFVEARAGGTVHMHRPRHPYIENKYTQLLAVLDADAGDQIKSWFYGRGATTAGRPVRVHGWGGGTRLSAT